MGGGLEERGAAGRAGPAPARGRADGGAAAKPRTAAVAGLGADRRADQAGHRTLRVPYGRVDRGDRAAVDVRGAAAAPHRLADERVAGARDGLRAAVQVHAARVRHARVGVLDEPVVVTREAGTGAGAEYGAVAGVGPPRGADVRAVPGGQEVGRVAPVRVEAQRAARRPGVDRRATVDLDAQRAGQVLQPG